MNLKTILYLFFVLLTFQSVGQHSIARQWNEEVLQAIRNDFARPTVHARNLFHTSIAMYDIWATYEQAGDPYLLGRKVGEYTNVFDGVSIPDDIDSAKKEAISYALYRLIKHRFKNSPKVDSTFNSVNQFFQSLGYDTTYVEVDYTNGKPAAFGNFVAQSLIAFGMQDYSNEANDYANNYYESINDMTNPNFFGIRQLTDPNRWQPLSFDLFIDQSGNVIRGTTPDFLSPEWGKVTPFALTESERSVFQREESDYWVYHDPGPPPYIDLEGGAQNADYQWNFAMVSVWGSHLDPSDNVMIDISPGSIGNIQQLPTDAEGIKAFYNYTEGGDIGEGHSMNPVTGQAYVPQIVPRADYARVLAEFWADGPDSETPPGHWFTILNYVNDHPAFQKKFKGEGDELDELEWDVKAYFTLGGSLHDAAVSAWGIKGWYDYIRPLSAIRSMGARGQCTDSTATNFHPAGLPLIEGYIEVVDENDPLSRGGTRNIGKIKIYTWLGPSEIDNPDEDVAGVGWILAEEWWPYQRPTFVTPPFAGYVSGHSTFSRAASEVLTQLTGDPFFPGGIGEFVCKKDEFLVFEKGPSQDIILQWATYKDASDQTSLSRIWGGIHPPADDIPGRLIGEQIGVDAFKYAEKYFEGRFTAVKDIDISDAVTVYPNPIQLGETLQIESDQPFGKGQLNLYDLYGRLLLKKNVEDENKRVKLPLDENQISKGVYILTVSGAQNTFSKRIIIH